MNRVYFQRWKLAADRMTVKHYNMTEGPVREQMFDIRQDLENFKRLLREEGYSEFEI